MFEKVTMARDLRRILRDKVGDWFRSSVVLTTLTAVAVVVPHALADEPVRRITLEQALQMFEENSLELRLVAAERDRALGFAATFGTRFAAPPGTRIHGRAQPPVHDVS